jgi:enoyl-CoA hydratase/carnithine racemase
MTDLIVTETKGAVRIVRMNRPEKKNALTIAMYEAFAAALLAADADPSIRAIVIAGAPGAFSAGNDIGDFVQNPPSGQDSAVFRMLKAIAHLAKPVVGCVDGAAVGIGTTMLRHCELVVASTRTKFQLPFLRLGLVPEGASTVLLPALVGAQRAAEWLLLGDAIDPETAKAAGLVNRVAPPEEVEAVALGLAERLAALPPEAMKLSKKLLRDPGRASVDAALLREGDVFVERLKSTEAQQALMGFLSKPKG